jgi:hypothetical protein
MKEKPRRRIHSRIEQFYVVLCFCAWPVLGIMNAISTGTPQWFGCVLGLFIACVFVLPLYTEPTRDDARNLRREDPPSQD